MPLKDAWPAIALFMRIYNEDDAFIELPIIVQMALSPVFFHVIHTRLYVQDSLTPTTTAGIIAFCLFSICASFAMLAIARQDLFSRRSIAEHAASVRQAAHTRREVEAIARRAVSLRKLRHDLVNQIAVVERLAASGQVDEADRYLDVLQQQSRELSIYKETVRTV